MANKEKLRKELRKPIVFIKGNSLRVVYKNRSVLYKLENTSTFKELSKEQGSEFTREDEIDMAKWNHERQLKFMTEEEDKIWEEILSKEEN